MRGVCCEKLTWRVRISRGKNLLRKNENFFFDRIFLKFDSHVLRSICNQLKLETGSTKSEEEGSERIKMRYAGNKKISTFVLALYFAKFKVIAKLKYKSVVLLFSTGLEWQKEDRYFRIDMLIFHFVLQILTITVTYLLSVTHLFAQIFDGCIHKFVRMKARFNNLRFVRQVV